MEEMIVLIGNFGFPVAGKLEGMKVLLTRERDIYVSLADRVALSRWAGSQRPDDCYAENAFNGKANAAVAVVGK